MAELGIDLKVYQPCDPAFPEYGEPKVADLVCCIDVLEYIEPELIDNVVLDLVNITSKFGFFSVHMGRAVKESLMAYKRAGADAILTYYALDLARWIKNA